MTYVYPLDHRYDLPLPEVTMLVGGKAANLGVMAADLGLPVPPGMAITTAACRSYLAEGWPAGLEAELREGMAAIEGSLGRRFGDPADPLLVSVRSGAPVSMPGMMDTILNLGLNEDTTRGLGRVTADDEFAGDCRRRLQTMFREIVGADVPEDPWVQLRAAVEAVFRSWNSDRAQAYRRREGIPDDIGTGVTVQAMVFGNRGQDSATGVVFTRNPATGDSGLYGDVLFGAQGEDVVAGTHATQPLSVLDERLPEVAAELRDHAARLERHYRDLCDIEFTIEAGRLWLLQVRVGKRSPRAALRIAIDMASDDAFPLSREEAVTRVSNLLEEPPRSARSGGTDAEPLTVGLPASPGVATGEIVTSPEDAVRAADAGRSAILVRAETSPDDVHGMARAAGILTARGGLASHAAVVARGWGIPAVVGAADVDIRDGEVRLGRAILRSGEVITIDGDSGAVFEGAVGGESEIVPEAQTLLAWSRELGSGTEALPNREPRSGSEPRGASYADAAATIGPDEGKAAGTTGAGPAATADECLAVLGIKGFASAEAIGHAVLCGLEETQPLLQDLVEHGLATPVAGAYRITDAGKDRCRELLAADQEAVGMEFAGGSLDAFLAIDHEVKVTVTDWQLRSHGDASAVNDHSDPDYDAAVLARLASVHADAVAWIAGLAERWPRAARYRARLDRAIGLALEGDHRYVASPRVDSYHGIWFELHEELILLAGRTRDEEVAAGRA
jgi:pyruvate,orthophosphate dikinase